MSATTAWRTREPVGKPADASFDRYRRSGLGGFEVVLAGGKDGETWAMEAIYRCFHRPVHAYLRAQLAPEADDLTSEVFVAIAARIRYFVGDEVSFRSWVFAIAYRRLADHRRWRARHPIEPFSFEGLGGDCGDAEVDALAALDEDTALRKIAALPRAQAQVVLLRVVGDLSVDEVAGIVGKRPGAVRALQFRALRYLAQELEAAPKAEA